MKAEAQRIAIAEACWPDVEVWHDQVKGCFIRGKPITGRADNIKALPDYLNDLNAMHEAEEVLKGGMRSKYDAELTIIAARDHCFIWETDAAHKSEAFLKTLNLWTT